MKNNKGFTLVEILAIIIILSIVIVLVYPVTSDVIFGSRKTINELSIKSIKDSANMFAQDIYLCDSTVDIISILKSDLKYTNVTNCKQAKEQLKKGITIPVEVLKNYDYVNKVDKCSGDIKITLSGDNLSDVTINTDKIKCTE